MPGLAALIPVIIQGIQIAITNAPKFIEAMASVRNMIAGWFGSGVITKEQQDACFAYVDGVVAMTKAGIVPPHWTVEPDPQS